LENDKIAEILQLPAFTIKKKQGGKDKEKRPTPWNAFSLIPNPKIGYNEYDTEIYRIKLLCSMAAGNDIKGHFYLFEEKSLLDVHEILMYKRAINYEL
jgi:hypothetical protein